MLWHYEGVRWWSGLGRQFKTLTSYCHVINNTFWSLPLGHGLPTRPDTNLFRYFVFSMPSHSRKKLSVTSHPASVAILLVFCKPICWFRTWFGEINFPRRTARGQQAGKQHPVLTMTITMLAVWRQRGSGGLTDWLIEAVAASSGQHKDCGGGQQTCNPCLTLFSMVSIMLENTTKHLWTGG